jgi:two-component system alkaline phosphatase synthesis response regulator PhoP
VVILVVVEEPDVSDLLAYILKRSGHDVLLARDCESGTHLWRQHDPSLVLLDLDLPDEGGWEMCRLLGMESPARTPVILLSSSDAENDIVKGLDMGAEDYITKPFSPRVLQARVKTLLRRTARDP